jgi:lipopolysaccharide/colanic/teichoic acid biosynthesis glycosyltransferase
MFYKQSRIGLKGQRFTLYKIRTMIKDAEKNGPQFSCGNDPRITTIGKILRKLHIDELPQFINVIKGDMSLVGPRPERPEMIDFILGHVPDFCERTSVKPGLTGLSQINMNHCECVIFFKNKFEMDMYYIENRTLFLDARIVFATFLKLFYIRGEWVNKLLFVDYNTLKKNTIEIKKCCDIM